MVGFLTALTVCRSQTSCKKIRYKENIAIAVMSRSSKSLHPQSQPMEAMEADTRIILLLQEA